jgi:hypothetical protein
MKLRVPDIDPMIIGLAAAVAATAAASIRIAGLLETIGWYSWISACGTAMIVLLINLRTVSASMSRAARKAWRYATFERMAVAACLCTILAWSISTNERGPGPGRHASKAHEVLVGELSIVGAAIVDRLQSGCLHRTLSGRFSTFVTACQASNSISIGIALAAVPL